LPMPKLCLGGSFNPIHHGHLLCARAAAEAVGAAGVVLMPTGQSPHKGTNLGMPGAADRVEMCRLAIEGVAGFELDERETRRQGPSYTIDTVREMKAEGVDKVYWLIGADMLNTLPSWREAPALLEEVNWVVMARPGLVMEWDTLGPEFGKLKANVVEVPQIDISATEIRRRVGAGLAIEYLTPAAVCRYIRERGLYR
jgi:nicotinate-nucleotide adenylyltransferase